MPSHAHAHVPPPTCPVRREAGYLHYTSSGFSERTKQKRRHVSQGRWWAQLGHFRLQRAGYTDSSAGGGGTQLAAGPVATGGASRRSPCWRLRGGQAVAAPARAPLGESDPITGSDGEGMRRHPDRPPAALTGSRVQVGPAPSAQASPRAGQGASVQGTQGAPGNSFPLRCRRAGEAAPAPQLAGPRWCGRSKLEHVPATPPPQPCGALTQPNKPSPGPAPGFRRSPCPARAKGPVLGQRAGLQGRRELSYALSALSSKAWGPSRTPHWADSREHTRTRACTCPGRVLGG